MKTDEKGNEELIIRGRFRPIIVPYDEISSLEMREGMVYTDQALYMFGVGGYKRLTGTFRNSELGAYRTSVYLTVKKSIILRKNDGKTIVFNLETEEKTIQLYDKLRKLLA